MEHVVAFDGSEYDIYFPEDSYEIAGVKAQGLWLLCSNDISLNPALFDVESALHLQLFPTLDIIPNLSSELLTKYSRYLLNLKKSTEYADSSNPGGAFKRLYYANLFVIAYLISPANRSKVLQEFCDIFAQDKNANEDTFLFNTLLGYLTFLINITDNKYIPNEVGDFFLSKAKTYFKNDSLIYKEERIYVNSAIWHLTKDFDSLVYKYSDFMPMSAIQNASYGYSTRGKIIEFVFDHVFENTPIEQKISIRKNIKTSYKFEYECRCYNLKHSFFYEVPIKYDRVIPSGNVKKIWNNVKRILESNYGFRLKHWDSKENSNWDVFISVPESIRSYLKKEIPFFKNYKNEIITYNQLLKVLGLSSTDDSLPTKKAYYLRNIIHSYGFFIIPDTVPFGFKINCDAPLLLKRMEKTYPEILDDNGIDDSIGQSNEFIDLDTEDYALGGMLVDIFCVMYRLGMKENQTKFNYEVLKENLEKLFLRNKLFKELTKPYLANIFAYTKERFERFDELGIDEKYLKRELSAKTFPILFNLFHVDDFQTDFFYEFLNILLSLTANSDGGINKKQADFLTYMTDIAFQTKFDEELLQKVNKVTSRKLPYYIIKNTRKNKKDDFVPASFNLDDKTLDRISTMTLDVRNTLNDIFSDEESEVQKPASAPKKEKVTKHIDDKKSSNTTNSKEVSKVKQFDAGSAISNIIKKDFWKSSEIRELAKSYGMLEGKFVEFLNTFTDENYGDFILEEADGGYDVLSYIKSMLEPKS